MTLWTELLGAEVGFIGNRYRTRALRAGSPDGPPLLLLHGQGGSIENFRRNIPAYAERYRVLAIDALWHGLSEKPPIDDALVPTMIEQILDVLDSQGIERCYLEGQSMGGWVATHFALRHPDRLHRLVLTTPSGMESPLTVPDEAKLQTQLQGQLEILRNPTPEMVRKRMSGLVHDIDTIDAEMYEVRQRFMQWPEVNAGLQAAITAYLGPAAQALKIGPDELGALQVPTLLYWGSYNMGGRAAGDALAAALPMGCRYHCAEVGHWAQFEQAEEHNRVVLEFLAG